MYVLQHLVDVVLEGLYVLWMICESALQFLYTPVLYGDVQTGLSGGDLDVVGIHVKQSGKKKQVQGQAEIISPS